MNYRIVTKVLGHIIFIEAFGMVLPLIVAIYYKEAAGFSFLISIAIMLSTGLFLKKIPVKNEVIRVKEGFSIVAFGWLVASIFGALPFIISGSIPNFIDALFETISGFTTTGATIITNIEPLPKSILFWRSFTHWIGGMGIIVFTIAILPAIGAGGFHIFKAESPGPISDRIAPKINDTAKILYFTYIIITFAEIFLLKLGGLSFFDSFIHTFGTVGTGGFSNYNSSIAEFDSTYIHIVISVFMLMSGANFSLYYELLRGKWKNVIKDNELRFYLLTIVIAVTLIAINLRTSVVYNNTSDSLKYSLFQVSSIITTTGYATTDFDLWPTFSKAILFMLMFMGGCAGSTGGGMKQIRILLVFKLVKREFKKILHPRAMIPLKINGKAVPSDVVANVSSFFILYIFVFVIGTIVVSLEGIGLVSAASSVAATLGNIGPGFELVGASQNYDHFSYPTKGLLSFFMLLGRLELFTILSLISPSFWRKEY